MAAADGGWYPAVGAASSCGCDKIRAMNVQTIADITPNGSAVAIAAVPVEALWILICATGTSIRVGDSNVGTARGAKVANATSLLLPRTNTEQGRYDLSQVYVYGAAGSDSASIVYGT